MKAWMAVLGLLAAWPSPGAPADGRFNVRDFGAAGDGAAKDTLAIQKAIDAAGSQGGGTVVLPPGRYLSGTLRLASHVTLYLENGATLAASPNNADFAPYEKLPFTSVSDEETTYFHYGLVTAENAEHIAIAGQGTIDGNRTRRHGPKTIAIKLCRHVSIRGITVRNSPNYSISLWGSDFVDIDGVTVVNGFADGIDPDACRFVRIANCYIDCYDDAICPKASPSMGMDQRRGVEHLVVANCVTRTNCSNFKFGTESSGDFKDVAVTNLTMLPRETGRRPISGISLESVDGARIEGVVISNISMAGVQTPLFIRLGNRGRGLDPPVPGSIRNVSLQNIVARGASMTSSITGIPGAAPERVSLSGMAIEMEGGNRIPGGLDVPEHVAKYPEGTMFGVLPAFGLYCRHAAGLSLSGLRLNWEQEDHRPAVVLDDVADLNLDGFHAERFTGPSPVVWLNNVRGALVRGARAPAADLFLRVSGAASRGIVLAANDLSRAARRVDSAGAPPNTVQETR